MPAGRPSTYTDETANKICDRLASGESMASICRDDAMPAQSTVYMWLASNGEFAERYARARENQMEAMADEILTICDIEEDVNRARLKVDARKWLMARLAPKKYGDRQETTIKGNMTLTIDPDDEAA